MRPAILKSATGICFALLVCTPLFVAAANVCPNITRTLTVGARGDDVFRLQKYLINEGELLADYATGYFGPLTETAVGNWQRAHKIVSSNEREAGWGVVGPRTRAAIALNCDPAAPSQPSGPSSTTTTSANSITQCRPAPRPTSICLASWVGVRNSNGCITSWYCVSSSASSSVAPLVSSSTIATPSNKPPIISSLIGPTALDVGEVGRWTVAATDPEGGALTYGFVWGDSGSSAFDQIQRYSQTFSATTTGTHAFLSAGNFTISATAHDSANNTTETSLTVAVPRAASANSTSGANSCNSAAGIYRHGQIVTGQLISGGPFTYSTVVPQYTCTNGTWVCTQYCSPQQGGTVKSADTGSASTFVNGATFWCFTASTGYWSSTPCANSVEHDPTQIGSGNPFGSSNADAQIGGICAPDGRQEFLACPAMQNCFGGGTYLLCKNGFWVAM